MSKLENCAHNEKSNGMTLMYSTHSPFARKVRALVIELGVDNISLVECETSPTNPNASVSRVNPLGKVPALLLSDGCSLFDSSVICEYLCSIHPCEITLPTETKKRFVALKMNALSNGLCEAGIALRWETERRPVQFRFERMANAQRHKIYQGIDYLASHLDLVQETIFSQIAVACAVEWLSFRKLIDLSCLDQNLFEWVRNFSDRPCMRHTSFFGDAVD